MRFWTTDFSYNDFFNSAPWPLSGHPEAMKMSCRHGYFTPGWGVLRSSGSNPVTVCATIARRYRLLTIMTEKIFTMVLGLMGLLVLWASQTPLDPFKGEPLTMIGTGSLVLSGYFLGLSARHR
jgi:hypothetical protein